MTGQDRTRQDSTRHDRTGRDLTRNPAERTCAPSGFASRGDVEAQPGGNNPVARAVGLGKCVLITVPLPEPGSCADPFVIQQS